MNRNILKAFLAVWSTWSWNGGTVYKSESGSYTHT